MVGHLCLDGTLIALYYLYTDKSVHFDHLKHSSPNTPTLYTATLNNMFDALSGVVSVYVLCDLMVKGRKYLVWQSGDRSGEFWNTTAPVFSSFPSWLYRPHKWGQFCLSISYLSQSKFVQVSIYCSSIVSSRGYVFKKSYVWVDLD